MSFPSLHNNVFPKLKNHPLLDSTPWLVKGYVAFFDENYYKCKITKKGEELVLTVKGLSVISNVPLNVDKSSQKSILYMIW